MATPSYKIMNEIYVMRQKYQEEGNFEASLATDLIDDHVDALKSQYYDAREYYEQVVKRINALLETPHFEKEARDAMTRILNEIVLPHQSAYLERQQG